MKERLTSELKKLPENFVVLTILPRDQYTDLNMHLLKLLVEKKERGTYVAINKPYLKIIKDMENYNLDHKKLLFIDCVTEKPKKVDNCVFIQTPQSLTKIGIALNPVYENSEHAFIFLDSLDGLLVYHNSDMLIKFARSMIEKIREKNKAGVMIGLHKDTEQRIIDELELVCDKVIDLTI